MSERPANLSNRSCSPSGSKETLLDDKTQRMSISSNGNTIRTQIFGTSSPLAPAVADLLKATGFAVAGVWDADAFCVERFAREHHIPAHSSNIDTVILQEQPVLNVVIAPSQYAAEIVIKSLSLDKHVLTIPPSMLDLHEATRSLRAAQYAPDLVASPLFPLRALPGIARLREILFNNDLGRVLAVEARVVGGRVLPFESAGTLPEKNHESHRHYSKWSWDKRMLGAPLDTVMAHVIDLITCLAAAANSQYDGIGCRIGRVTSSATDLDNVLKQQQRHQSADDLPVKQDFDFYCRPNAECIVMSHMLSQNRLTQYLMSLNFLYPDRPFELDVHVSCTHGRARIRKENACSRGGVHDTSSCVDVEGSASLLDSRRRRTEEAAGCNGQNNIYSVAADKNLTDSDHLESKKPFGGSSELLREAASYKVAVEKYDTVSGSCIDEQTFDLIPSSLFYIENDDDPITTTPVPHSSDGIKSGNEAKPREILIDGLPGGTFGGRRPYDSFYCSSLMLGGLRATLEQVRAELTQNMVDNDTLSADGEADSAGKPSDKSQYPFPLPSLFDGVYTMQVISALRTSCDQHDRWQTVMLPSTSGGAAGMSTATAAAGEGINGESCFSYINNRQFHRTR